MRVSIYFNLHRKLFSVRAEEGPEKGRVIAHASDVGLHFCEFRVSQAGNQRVRDTGQKNIHAFIRGDLAYLKADRKGGLTAAGERAYQTASDEDASKLATYCPDELAYFKRQTTKRGVPVTYNPYVYRTFVTPSEDTAFRPVRSAATVLASLDAGCIAIEPRA